MSKVDLSFTWTARHEWEIVLAGEVQLLDHKVQKAWKRFQSHCSVVLRQCSRKYEERTEPGRSGSIIRERIWILCGILAILWITIYLVQFFFKGPFSQPSNVNGRLKSLEVLQNFLIGLQSDSSLSSENWNSYLESLQLCFHKSHVRQRFYGRNHARLAAGRSFLVSWFASLLVDL